VKSQVTEAFCPYCGGTSGWHVWAGSGQCPGTVSEVTPVVNDSEMLRAYGETIRLREAEIERLKVLLARAADALEGWIGDLPASDKHLVQELRKAAK
jgi:hypothetical protein